MSLSCRYAAQCCARQLRATASTSASVRAVSAPALQQRIARRHNSTEAAAASPKISGIVDQISQLTLLETADLVASLKVALSARAGWGDAVSAHDG
jgi:large subunit ribosomal protein L7/L12